AAAAHPPTVRRHGRRHKTGRGTEPDTWSVRPILSGTAASGSSGDRTEGPGGSEGRRWASVTSTTDRAEHPDVAEISDLTEGLLAPDRTAAVRQHLDGCDLCAEVHASLEEIRGLLGAVPGPPRMPDDVARRIDAALAAEALLDAGVPDTRESEDAVDASAPPSQGGRARVSRESSAPPPPDRPGGSARASTTGPGRKGRTRRGRRRVAVLGTVFTVAALGLGSVLLASLDDTGRPEEERQVSAADTRPQGPLARQVAG